MFAYCGNNPFNNIDKSGTCFYNANGVWCHDNWEYLGGYERQPDPATVTEDVDTTTQNNTIQDTVENIWYSLEADVALGFGWGGALSIDSLAGANLGFAANPVHFRLDNGKFSIVESLITVAEVDVPVYQLGYRNTAYISIEDGSVTEEGYVGATTGTVGVSAMTYIGVGGYASIAINWVELVGLEE